MSERDQQILVEAPVSAVTVMEDRAQVTRTARLELAAGRHQLRVERVTPLVVDRTLRATLGGAAEAKARLVDVGVRRESTVAATRPDQQQALADQREALGSELLALDQQLRVGQAEASALGDARAKLLEQIAREAGAGEARRERWRASLAALDERLGDTEQKRRRLAAEREDLGDRIERLEQRLLAASMPSVVYFGSLRAEVELEQPGALEVSWEYLVPCALWRPSHRAELLGEVEARERPARLRWRAGGTVWQNTGEAWEEIRLRLSTERPALGAEVPLLDEDLLRLRSRTDQEKRTVEVSSRDEEIEVIAPGTEGGRKSSALPGVEDGGEVRVFELPHRVSIPSDGRAHLVEVLDFETEAALDLVCAPGLELAVLLRSRQSNEGGQPLLAGPVELVRNGGFCGRTQVDFVAAGERFALGWGSLDELAVARTASEHSEEVGLTRRTRRKARVHLFFANTGATPRRVRVTERIPVSEIEQVTVELDDKETSRGYTRGNSGHLHWDLELPPTSRRELKLRYMIEAHRSVVWR